MLSIELQGGEAVREELARVAERLGRQRPLHARWSQAVAIKMRNNARAKGGRRLWREIAQATRVDGIGEDGASIGVYHVAARMRHTGGTITPTRSRALTIPITREAEGTRAAEWEQGGHELFSVSTRTGDPSTLGILGYSDGDGFVPLFVLRTRVDHPADPWLPDDDEIARIGLDEANRLVGELFGGEV